LGIDKGTIKYHSERYEVLGAALGRNGRPSILSDEHCEDLVRQIEEVSYHGIPWTITKILQLSQERAAETMDKNSVYHWLHREPHIKSWRRVRIEDRPFEVTPEAVVDYFQLIIDIINSFPVYFVFNADEMGHQEWANRHRQSISSQRSTQEIKSVIRSRARENESLC
jgi:hypothetical protein